MSYKQEKIIVIVSEFVNDKREYYPITDIPIEKVRFFYKNDDGLFKAMSSSDYAVRTETNEMRLYITNEKIKNESLKFQVGYEINFSASEYETSLPVLSVLVEMYNTLIEDSRTIFNYVKKQCFISDDKTTSLILPNLPSYTVWCMGENGEMFALPVNELYSKFGEMLNKLKSILADYTESKKEEIRGATFFPHLMEDGTLSWTNDKNKPNPEPVNIKGPAGTIENVTASVNSNAGVPSVKVTMSGTKENRSFDLEFQNLKGDPAIKGKDYYTEEEKQQFTTEMVGIVKTEGNKVVEQVKSIVAGNPATTNALTLSGKTRAEYDNEIETININLNKTKEEVIYSHIQLEPTESYINLTTDFKNGIAEINNGIGGALTIDTTPNYYHYDLNVIEGDIYKITARVPTPNHPLLVFVDTNNKILDYYPNPVKEVLVTNYKFTIPKKCVRLIISHNGNTDNTMPWYEWHLWKIKENYETTTIKQKCLELNNKTTELNDKVIQLSKNILFGKKIVCIGDSIVKGQGYNGDNKGNKSYVNIIAEKNNMICKNYAVSGATICSGTNPSVFKICDNINTMDADADYIVVGGGYNDFLYNTPLGKISEDYTTPIANINNILGGCEKMCRELLLRYEGKKILFVFSHKINDSPYMVKQDWNHSSRTMTDVHDKIVEVLRKYSIPYCDLFNTSSFNTAINNYLKYTANNDGTHPTKQGYELFYVPQVEEFLKRL